MELTRRHLVAGSAIFATLALAGCGRAGATKATGTAGGSAIGSSPATGTIEFWAQGADAKSLPKLLAAFKKANPKATINITSVPEDNFDAKMTSAIAAGKVPDVVYLQTQTQSTLLKTGGFAAVPDGLVDSSDFFSASWQGTLMDGTSYAVPWYTYANVMYYRKDLAKQAGVEAPTTWAETKTFAAALKKQGVAFPIGLSVGYDSFSAQALSEYSAQNGGALISADRKTWTINSAENVAALEYWGSLISDGYASADTPGFLDTVPFFTSGKIAANVNGPWFPGWLSDAKTSAWVTEHVGVVVPPAGSAGSVASTAGGSLAVLKDAANATAAWKLVRYMSTADAQLAWYKIFGNLPAVKSAWEDSSIADDPMLAPVKTAIATARAVPNVPGWGQVGTIIGQQMERVARGKATAKEALDAAQSQAVSIGTGIA